MLVFISILSCVWIWLQVTKSIFSFCGRIAGGQYILLLATSPSICCQKPTRKNQTCATVTNIKTNKQVQRGCVKQGGIVSVTLIKMLRISLSYYRYQIFGKKTNNKQLIVKYLYFLVYMDVEYLILWLVNVHAEGFQLF